MKHIGDDILERFKILVGSHIGLRIGDHDGESFRKALTERMNTLKITGPEEYFNFLESNTDASTKEWKSLILRTTTGESYFFRDKGHFNLLQNIVLPELIDQKQNLRSLRIWSAGCATGEEPYSIAILLDMLLPELKGWQIDIIGTDINEEFLNKAARGVYSDWSFRMVDKDIKNRYFSKSPAGWEIRKSIKNMVKFQYGNLMDAVFFAQYPEISEMDIIVCRNVFIYFKPEAVSSVFAKFMNILNREGYLITGHGELHGQNLGGLRPILLPEAVIYKKTSELSVQTPEIKKTPERNKEYVSHKMNLKQVNKPSLSAEKTFTKQPYTQTELEGLICRGQYAKAIDKANSFILANQENDCILFLVAQAYANAGDYANAERSCRRAITLNADSSDSYFLLAQIAEAKGNDDEAKELLHKVLYLNPAFIPAYCELGGLFERHDDRDRSRKYRATAIEFLSSLPSGAPVKPYDITSGELLTYIRSLQ